MLQNGVIAVILNLSIYNQLNRFFNDFERCDEPFPWIVFACDMGLEIPQSHIYKKFNIPKPENGEEVLKPPQAGMMTAQQQPMETTEELKLKQEEGQAEQRQVDTIVSIANKTSEDIFREMMKPIFKMIDKAEDMDELQKVLKDEKKLRELYRDMESPELEDLIQQGIYLSHLIGRSMD